MAERVRVRVHRLDPRKRMPRWPRSLGGLGCCLGCFLGLLFSWIVIPLTLLAVVTSIFLGGLPGARYVVRWLARLVARRGRRPDDGFPWR